MLFKKLAIALTIIGVQGCGFQPMYSGDCLHRQPITLHFKGEGASAYKFRRELEKHLAIIPKFDSHDYVVNVTLNAVKEGETYASDSSIIRTTDILNANYTVKRDGIPLNENTSDIKASYPILNKENYITITAENATDYRIAVTLAEDVARDIVRLMRAQK